MDSTSSQPARNTSYSISKVNFNSNNTLDFSRASSVGKIQMPTFNSQKIASTKVTESIKPTFNIPATQPTFNSNYSTLLNSGSTTNYQNYLNFSKDAQKNP